MKPSITNGLTGKNNTIQFDQELPLCWVRRRLAPADGFYAVSKRGHDDEAVGSGALTDCCV
jgi:hypothetical protein